MNETDLTLLLDMRDYALEVVAFAQGQSREALDDNLLLLRGLCMSIGIIGEAASKISAETREAYPAIRWSEIIRMRNFLFHVYRRVDAEIVWATATKAVPELLRELEKLIPPARSESGHGPDDAVKADRRPETEE